MSMLNDAYKPATNATPAIRGGIVRSYDPDRRLYVVDVDSKGETTCKQLDTGILKPFATSARVLVSQFAHNEWSIVGELPRSANYATVDVSSEDETLARSRGRLQGVANPFTSILPYYRTTDTVGEAEVPVFEGDVRIENRTERTVSRSFLHIFKFGDILAKASSFCYIHLSKFKSTIIVKARDLRIRLAGYTKDIITPVKGPTAGRTTVTEEFFSNPLSIAEITTKTGDLLGTPRLVLGTETTFLGGFTHIDLTSNTIRQKTAGSILSIGDITGVVPVGDNVLFYPQVGRGISLQTSKGHVTVNDLTDELVLSVPGLASQVSISPVGITLVRAGQSIALTEAGVSITATNLNIAVSGQTNILTAGPTRLAGSTIHLN